MHKSHVLKEKVRYEAGQLLRSCLIYGQNLRLKAKSNRVAYEKMCRGFAYKKWFCVNCPKHFHSDTAVSNSWQGYRTNTLSKQTIRSILSPHNMSAVNSCLVEVMVEVVVLSMPILPSIFVSLYFSPRKGEWNKKEANLVILYLNVCQLERGRKLKGAKYDRFGLGGEN